MTDTTSQSGQSFPHLDDAPAEEAIIFLGFKPNENASLDALNKLYVDLQEDFPTKKDLFVGAYGKEYLPEEDLPEEALSQKGFQIESQDRSFVSKIRLNSLFLSKLRPYTDGTELIENYQHIFESYNKHMRHKVVHRVAMRYINQFDLPADEAGEYLKSIPTSEFYDKSPAYMGENLFRTTLTDDSRSNIANIVQLLRPYRNDEGVMMLNVILDIEAIREGEFETEWKNLNKIMSELRYLKNNAFFGCVTEECVKLFSPK